MTALLNDVSYDDASFSVSGQDGEPRGVVFSPDGTKAFMVGATSDAIHQYSTPDPNDVSTWSYDSVSFSVSAQDKSPTSIAFSPDGTKLFMVGTSAELIHQYSTPDPNDVSTWSYDSVSFSVGSQENGPQNISFSPDGSKLFMVGTSSDTIHQYSTPSQNDANTWSYDSVSFSVAGQDGVPRGVVFSPDGAKLFMVGAISDAIHQYSTPDPNDVSTWSYDSVSFSVLAQDASSDDIFFSPDGAKLFMLGDSSDDIYQYSIAEGGPTTPEQIFQATYADASAADPKATALIRPADVQRSIDTDVSNLADGPNLYVVEAIFDIGELQNLNPYNPTTEKPRVFFVKDDQPGLRQGKNLLLKGYTIRDADPAVPVTCTFWG